MTEPTPRAEEPDGAGPAPVAPPPTAIVERPGANVADPPTANVPAPTPLWSQGAAIARSFLADAGAGLVRILYPPACAHCHGRSPGPMLCDTCRPAMLATADMPVCPRCGAVVGPAAYLEKGCFLCRESRYAFERVVRLGRYEGELKHACLRIKDPRGSRLATALADLLVEVQGAELRTLGADLIVPIPLHWLRHWRRGYDQAGHLAQRLGLRLGLPVRAVLRRRRPTSPQSELSPTERRRNVRGAFRVRPSPALQGASVLLVDDILTTGATCHQAARVLRRAGARRVVVAVVARGDHVPNILAAT